MEALRSELLSHTIHFPRSFRPKGARGARPRLPDMQHGARPLPMILLHIDKCGRNCAIRKGKPVPAALPTIEEDIDGECKAWTRSRKRTVHFPDGLMVAHPRFKGSRKFKKTKKEYGLLRSPPADLSKKVEEIQLKAHEGVVVLDVILSPGLSHLALSKFKPQEARLRFDFLGSMLPTLPTIKEDAERESLDTPLVKTHMKRCAENCGQAKRMTQPSMLPVIEEEQAMPLTVPSTTTITTSEVDLDSPSKSPMEYEHVLFAPGLVGLGIINISELMYLSASSVSEVSLALPETLVRGEMDPVSEDCFSSESKSLVDTTKLRISSKMKAKKIVAVVREWVKRRMGSRAAKVEVGLRWRLHIRESGGAMGEVEDNEKTTNRQGPLEKAREKERHHGR